MTVSTAKETIVVVGTGIAGATAAQTLRTQGFDGRIVVVGAERTLPYRRPMVSKDFLFATPPALDRALIQPVEFWADNRIEIRTGTTATRLDTAQRTVSLTDGEVIRYDAALLATGASARPFNNRAGSRIHTLRTIADAVLLHNSLKSSKSLLVLGGGLIGSEAAAAARHRGIDVTILECALAPMSRILPTGIVDAYVRLHTDNGVDIRTGVVVESLRDNGSGVVATAADGRVWRADIALAAVGSVPQTALAADAGIELGDGIVVDERFATSAPDVHAAGDVASVPNPLVGRHRGQHWNSARGQGEAAAKAILGHDANSFEVPWGWSTQYGRTLQFAGWPAADDAIDIDGDLTELDFVALARRRERVVGAVAIGRSNEFRRARTLITVEALVGSRR